MVSLVQEPFIATLDSVIRELRRACATNNRQMGDIQRNASLWLAFKCEARDAAVTFGTPSIELDEEILDSASSMGAIGFLAGTDLLTADQLAITGGALRKILARKPSTAERSGYAQNPVRLLGLVLLARAIGDRSGLDALTSAFPDPSPGAGFPAVWFRQQAALELGRTEAPFGMRTPECTPTEFATIVVARSMDFAVARATFPLVDLDSADDLLARKACQGEVVPAADLASMMTLLGLETTLRRRFSGAQDPLALLRTLCTNFVSALERWPDGAENGVNWPIQDEADIQRLLYFQLRSVFPSTVYEDPQPKDGVRSTRPDFGIRDLRLAIEAKYIHRPNEFGRIQQELESDSASFFPGSGRYKKMIMFVYDASRSTDRHYSLQTHLKQLPNVADAFVVSPPGRLSTGASSQMQRQGRERKKSATTHRSKRPHR